MPVESIQKRPNSLLDLMIEFSLCSVHLERLGEIRS
jgi:hypothetical protein